MTDRSPEVSKTYVVEHLDPELGPWSALEYAAIAQESTSAGARFCLSSIPATLNVPSNIISCNGTTVEHRCAEEIFAELKNRVCLLDPAANAELAPDDSARFDIFLFGGILGMKIPW